MREQSEFKTSLVDGVLTVQLDRPQKMNALTLSGVSMLRQAMVKAAEDNSIKCMLLTGSGSAFCAGRDLSDAKPNEDAAALLRDQINPLISVLFNFPKPTVSAVNGAAMGIGLGLALAADIIIASDSAVFSSPFARLGGALDSGGHYFLAHSIGINRTFEMIFTSDKVSARNAADWGMVNRVVRAELLMPMANQLARKIASGPMEAFLRQKALLRSSDLTRFDSVLEREAAAQGELSRTADYAEGLNAFREKRTPHFGKI